jgi:hypothetical protein
MYTPDFMILDYESALLDGSPSVEFYKDDFRSTMAGWAWRGENGDIRTKCTVGEDDTLNFFKRVLKSKIQLVVHNFAFEWAVTKWRFPGMESLVQIDTMRLAQLTDNGGPEHYEETFEDALADLEGRKPFNGLSLEACASRFCGPEFYKHKQPYLDLILERGGKKGDFHLLTQDELIAYNLKDVETTLNLYEVLIDTLGKRGIDWQKDHYLYRSRCRLTATAKARGVLVDKEQVKRHIELETENINATTLKFYEAYRPQIAAVEARKALAWVAGCKSPKGQEGRRKQLLENPPEEIKFNLGSTKDKAALFMDELGLTPRFTTEKGAPTFGAKLLWQYGDVGNMLIKMGTYKISRAQPVSLDELSERDGRWHLDLKCTGARTGRLSGGSNG